MKKSNTIITLLLACMTLPSVAAVKVHRPQQGIQSAVTVADRVALGKPAPAQVLATMPKASAAAVLSEDFSKCVKGSEQTPDAEGVVGNIDASLTAKDGWVGATFHQAGGCAFLDLYAAEYQGQTMNVSLLDTPALGLTSEQTIVEVKFRARTKNGGQTPFYIINADASDSSTLSTVSLSITGEWADYTAYVTKCNRNSFLEFQTESAPFYIDDITVGAVPPLDTPKVLAATDITPDGFTANWTAVDDATGYIVNPKVLRTSDGLSPRYMLNADFNSITQGTIDDPVLPQYSVYSLDDIVPQKGWLARLPYFANGCLGLSNELIGTYGNSLLQSPTLNLSGAGGVINAKMRYLVKDVDMFQVNMYQVYADGRVSLRATKMVYTNEENNVWKDLEFTLGGGTVSSMIVVILPETTRGTVFFDTLSFDQVLDEGTRYSEPLASINSTSCSVRIDTPDAEETDNFAYSVTAYRTLSPGNNIYSDASNEIVVGQNSDVQPTSLDKPEVTSTTVDGGRFTATWKAVEGANAYRVDVYRRHISNGLESVDVINENFDGIIVGTSDLDHPRAMTTDGYDRLDDFTKVPGWEVFQGFYVDGAVGILGYWNMLGVGCYMRSPKFDLSANGGNMTMDITVGSDYYNQGATVYLAHEDEDTGAITYDDIFPLDEMEKGFHDFTTQFKNGREDSFFVFFPYGYGVSYFDNIRVRQQLPEGENVYKVSSRTTSALTATLQVPDINLDDTYYYTVTALWIDTNDLEKVTSEPSAQMPVEGLKRTLAYSGVVNDMEGNYISGATVSLASADDGGKVYTATANRWGLFRIDNIVETDGAFTPSAKATGYLSAVTSSVTFNGANIANVEFRLRKASSDTETEIGLPTGYSPVGTVYLQYNNSESETIYPAEAIGLPKGAKITSVAFDGYCDNEKDVTYRMELYMENTTDNIAADGFTPRDPASMTRFDGGNRKIAKSGSKEQSEEMVSFTNAEGFEYDGGNLRVRMSSKSNKGNYVYFLVDGSRRNHSMYRNWSSSESNDWKLNTDGMPVMRIDYVAPSVGIDIIPGAASSAVRAEGLAGAVRFTASEGEIVRVYSIDGICVATVAVGQGITTVTGFAPGLYIAAGQKVIVK